MLIVCIKRLLLRHLFAFKDLYQWWLMPNVCLGCGEINIGNAVDGKTKNCNDKECFLRQMFFCQRCIGAIDKNVITNGCCEKCGYPIIKENFLDKDKRCQSCKEYKPIFNISRSCYCYRGVIRRMLLNFKFYSAYDGLRFFGKSMYEKYTSQLKKADYVCFVPITRKKLFFKGFNHACELAKIFCKIAKQHNENFLLLYDFVVKTNTTQSSKTMHQQDRLLKKHCFQINDKYLISGNSDYVNLNYKTVLIIDDIMTTGGTLNAMARIIKHNFPQCKIECLTFARTMLW